MQKRILGVCSSLEMAEEVVDKCYELSSHLGMGVTLLYVKEEELFDLLIYENRNSNLDIVHKHFKKLFKERGIEDWVFLLKDGDIPDQVALEANRESSILIVTNGGNNKLSKLLSKVESPIYVLMPYASHKPKLGLLTIDSFEVGEKCLKFLRELEPKTIWRAYQDYQFFPTEFEVGVDPVINTISSNILLDEIPEILDSQRQSFKEFCKEGSIEGSFEIGEVSISEDILSELTKRKSDLLVIASEDRDTFLAQGAKELIDISPVDTIVCFKN